MTIYIYIYIYIYIPYALNVSRGFSFTNAYNVHKAIKQGINNCKCYGLCTWLSGSTIPNNQSLHS